MKEVEVRCEKCGDYHVSQSTNPDVETGDDSMDYCNDCGRVTKHTVTEVYND